MEAPKLKHLLDLQNSGVSEMRLLDAELEEKMSEPLSKNMIDLRMNGLKEIWSNMVQNHSEIMKRGDIENQPYVLENRFACFHAVYQKILNKLLDIQIQLNAADLNPAAPSLDDLPKFSGNIEDFERFAIVFVRLIHTNVPSDANRLLYLKQNLTDTAADLIKRETDYASAWRILKNHFYKPKRFIIQTHLNAIMNMPTLEKESATDLRNFVEKAQRIVSALATLRMPIDYWDIWLVHVLSSKLDQKTRDEWDLEVASMETSFTASSDESSPWLIPDLGTQLPQFTELMDFIERRSQILKEIEDLSPADESPAPPADLCPICWGAHRVGQCRALKSKTPHDRRTEIKRVRLCFNCLGTHRVQVCYSKGRCNICGDKHNTLLHLDD